MYAKYIAAFGILLSTVGAFYFAFEAIKIFSKPRLEVRSMGYRGQGPVTETPEFAAYDKNRISGMWIGLSFTVLGNGIQIAALFFD